MSVKNFVQCSLVTPVTAAASQLILNPPVAPYDYPPLTAGTVVIADSVARPSFYEVISYTHRIDNVLYGVTRGKEGTTARNWSGTTWVYQALTAADYVAALALKANAANAALTGVPTAPTAALGTNTNQIATMAAIQAAITALVQSSPAALDTLNELAAALGNDPNFATTMTAALAGKEPTIVAGTTAQYWAGNKTWQSLMTAVHGLQLTGLGAGSNTSIVTTDTILAALAKLQNQINNKVNSNDGRLTDSREWTAATVDQAEAVAGTATTRRAWTAQRIAQAVRGGLLTGLNLTAGTAVAATDTVLVAMGKLQKQISDLSSNISNSVRAAVLSGFTVGSNASVANTDSVEAAFGKTQAQINTLNTNKLATGATAAAADQLANARTIGMTGDVTWTSAGFNGSANVTGVATLANTGVAEGTYGKVTVNAKGLVTAGDALAATDIPVLDATKVTTGVFAAARIPTLNQSTTGNAATATKLQTARTINDVSFDGSANITVADTTKVPLTGATGAATIPAGTEAQRPASPVNGQLRYNSEKSQFEGYQGGEWKPIGGSEVDFTIIYPNGGTSGTPANIAANTRYVESNPFAGFYVQCRLEVLVSGQWIAPGLETLGGASARGGNASQLGGGSIIVQTLSNDNAYRPSNSQGNPAGLTSGSVSWPLPSRVLVWKVKGAV